MASCNLITTKGLQTWTPMRTHIKRNGNKHASIHINQNNIHEHCTCFSAVMSTCFIIASHFSFSSSTVCHRLSVSRVYKVLLLYLNTSLSCPQNVSQVQCELWPAVRFHVFHLKKLIPKDPMMILCGLFYEKKGG